MGRGKESEERRRRKRERVVVEARGGAVARILLQDTCLAVQLTVCC